MGSYTDSSSAAPERECPYARSWKTAHIYNNTCTPGEVLIRHDKTTVPIRTIYLYWVVPELLSLYAFRWCISFCGWSLDKFLLALLFKMSTSQGICSFLFTVVIRKYRARFPILIKARTPFISCIIKCTLYNLLYTYHIVSKLYYQNVGWMI